jgi:hypothetical protein
MAKKKPIFDNRKMTILMRRYVRNKKDFKLRDRILTLTLPLVKASLSKQGMYDKRYKADIEQECILKVLQAIPKFKPQRGNAFGFMWAVICNMSKSINKRFHRPVSSLSTDESAQKEAEANGKEVFQTPENQYVLNLISDAVVEAFDTNGFVAPKKKLHRKACKLIHKTMVAGDFFFNKSSVVRQLKDLGLDKKEIQQYCQYSLVVVRNKLLEARSNASTITHPKIGKVISTVVDIPDT